MHKNKNERKKKKGTTRNTKIKLRKGDENINDTSETY